MSEPQRRQQKQKKLARLEIVASLYKRGYSVRKIQAEVMKRLNLRSYALGSVQNDIQTILKELQEQRLDNAEYALQLELERIDETCRELWAQWEKSKEDYVRTAKKRKGVPTFGDEGGKMRTSSVETKEQNVVGLGNVAYISEIRQQLQERRKLLGLYAPEKKEVSGSMSFGQFLIETSGGDE